MDIAAAIVRTGSTQPNRAPKSSILPTRKSSGMRAKCAPSGVSSSGMLAASEAVCICALAAEPWAMAPIWMSAVSAAEMACCEGGSSARNRNEHGSPRPRSSALI
eukprot:scaffold43010_cov28-Tisochrysis_lutea.AAC.2